MRLPERPPDPLLLPPLPPLLLRQRALEPVNLRADLAGQRALVLRRLRRVGGPGVINSGKKAVRSWNGQGCRRRKEEKMCVKDFFLL